MCLNDQLLLNVKHLLFFCVRLLLFFKQQMNINLNIEQENRYQDCPESTAQTQTMWACDSSGYLKFVQKIQLEK